jgi:hypothetical protein
MRKIPRLTEESRDALWDDPLYEPSVEHVVDSINEEVEAALELLSKLHEEAGALVQLLTVINERTYHPALQFWRELKTRQH